METMKMPSKLTFLSFALPFLSLFHSLYAISLTVRPSEKIYLQYYLRFFCKFSNVSNANISSSYFTAYVNLHRILFKSESF